MTKALNRLRKGLASLAAGRRRWSLTDALFFDDAGYRRDNGDVAQNVDAGVMRSCYDHYLRFGRWEGRRYVVRRWGFSEAAAQRLCDGMARLEGLASTARARLAPGELAAGLRSPSGGTVARPRGHRRLPVDHGPWRAPLPRIARTPWVMVRLVVAPSARAAFAFQALGPDGQPLGKPAALFGKPGAPTRRLLRLPPRTVALEVVTLQERLRVQPVSVRLLPVTAGTAEGRMVRRLIHHHPRYVARPERDVRASLERVAGELDQPLRDVMWEAYGSTFPPPLPCVEYQDWIERVEQPAVAVLDREAPDRLGRLADRPLISVLVPVFNPSESALRACLDSVLTQSYPDWELCLVDDASSATHVRAVLEDYAGRDARVRVQHRAERGHICAASNDALAMARGPLVALLDHDDRLTRHALLQVVETLSDHPDAELCYSDEDKMRDDGTREQPHFKPAWDPDLVLSQNYLGHLLVMRTERARAVGGFRPGYEGSQDHDLVLRATEGLAPSQIVHIASVLYHWRMGDLSTAATPEAKPYTVPAGQRAIGEALQRRGLEATVHTTDVPNCYRVTWAGPEPAPRVTVIVPTRDAVDLLSRCVTGILETTRYPNVELIIVDNGSEAPATLDFLRRAQRDPRVVVLRDERPYSFSALNNRAVARARGELLALVNNDIEIIDPGWLEQLVAHAVRPEIGCVGALLLYPDQSIQHAGIVLGLHGLAGHPYKRLSGAFHGYFGRLRGTHTVSAVTGACLVVERRLYQDLGPLDEELAVAFNDVDFCIKVREAGYRNLVVPGAVLVHHESASRGYDHEPSKRKRFVQEIATMKRRWGSLLYEDPCYSPHLSLDHDDYSIRVPR